MTERIGFTSPDPELIDLTLTPPQKSGIEDMIAGLPAKLADGTPARTMGVSRPSPEDGTPQMLVRQDVSDGPTVPEWVEIPTKQTEVVK